METKTGMKYLRENEVEEIYQCEHCGQYHTIPRGCDEPYCKCRTPKKVFYLKKASALFIFFSYNRFKKDQVFLPVQLKEEWRELPLNLEPEMSEDDIFGHLNQDSTNPMTAPACQRWIKEVGIGHTSMSVGDVIDHNGEWKVCAPEGWLDVVWTPLEHGRLHCAEAQK